MEELKYVIEDSTIAELLGVQNFSTDEAAILELVKNAYDANALNLKITFQNDTLRFEDNGIGMNADDIKKHWMHIGKSSKEYEIIDENNKKRIQAGSKGVGRFALSRLGYRVCLKSKKIDSVGVIWKTDWNTSVLDENYDIHTKGTDDKYKTDPMKILEVHETTRTNGHGLGMWIVNNTCTMSGGEIQKICGEKGFEIEFTIGGKI